MCGLFGGFSAEESSTAFIDSVIELGVVSTIRGYDSGGVTIANTNNWHFQTHRVIGGITELLTSREFHQSIRDIKPNLFIGHTRAATKGNVNLENCQPIETKGLFGTHNGTIPEIGDAEKSDSRYFYDHLENVEGEIEIPYGIHSDHGAFALVYAEMFGYTLNFLRNSKRPLSFSYSYSKDKMLWFSEKDLLKCITDRGTNVYRDPVVLPPDRLITIDLQDFSGKEKLLDKPKVSQHFLIRKKKDANKKTCNISKLSDKRKDKKKGTEIVTVPKVKNSGKYSQEQVEIHRSQTQPANYRGPRGNMWTRRRVKRHLNDGCVVCGNSHTTEDKVFWIKNTTEYVCVECTDTTVAKEYIGDIETNTYESKLSK